MQNDANKTKQCLVQDGLATRFFVRPLQNFLYLCVVRLHLQTGLRGCRGLLQLFGQRIGRSGGDEEE